MLKKFILTAAAVISSGLPSFAQFITDQKFVQRQLTCKDVRQRTEPRGFRHGRNCVTCRRNADNHTSYVPEGTFRTKLYCVDLVVPYRHGSDYRHLPSWQIKKNN